MTGRRLAIGILGVLAVGAAAILVLGRDGPEAVPHFQGTMAAFAPAEDPQPAPHLSFTDAAGTSLNLDDFRGRVVLLNLWATWCAPCLREMPALDRLQATLGGDDFAVVALSIDREGAAAVEPFYAEQGLANLAVYLDPAGEAPRALGAAGLPTTVLIDRQGRLVGTLAGPAEWDTPEAEALVRHYIAGAAPG